MIKLLPALLPWALIFGIPVVLFAFYFVAGVFLQRFFKRTR